MPNAVAHKITPLKPQSANTFANFASAFRGYLFLDTQTGSTYYSYQIYWKDTKAAFSMAKTGVLPDHLTLINRPGSYNGQPTEKEEELDQEELSN